jgi:hypothetical protein
MTHSECVQASTVAHMSYYKCGKAIKVTNMAYCKCNQFISVTHMTYYKCDLKKMHRAEGAAKNFGVFRVKKHDFTPKIHIISNFRGARAGCVPPPPPGSAPGFLNRKEST